MNLHAIARAVEAVVPPTSVTLKSSTGYTTAADGRQSPTYATTTVQARIQAMAGSEIERVNALGFQGVMRKAYLNGEINGIVRKVGVGGDLMTFGGRTWLVAVVLEQWPDWACVALVLQTD